MSVEKNFTSHLHPRPLFPQGVAGEGEQWRRRRREGKKKVKYSSPSCVGARRHAVFRREKNVVG